MSKLIMFRLGKSKKEILINVDKISCVRASDKQRRSYVYLTEPIFTTKGEFDCVEVCGSVKQVNKLIRAQI